RLHHVVVAIAGETGPQPVGGLGGLSVADPVGDDDVVPGRVEELTRAEEDPGEVLREEPPSGSGRPVQDEDGVADDSLRVLSRGAERPVVDPQLRQRLAAGEVEVLQDAIAGSRLRKWRARE